jgi:AmmeMemoRadiSam system protein B
MGRPSVATVRLLANALNHEFAQANGKTLFVATTNLNSPYHGEEPDPQEQELFLRLLETGDSEEIVRQAAAGHISACGAACAAVLLHMGGVHMKPRLLARGDSGQGSPILVGYAALALVQETEG